jgi:hypothetical protein
MSLGCKCGGNIWLGRNFFQQFAGTRSHRRRPGLHSIFQKLLHAAAQGSIVLRKVREPLKSKGLHYRTAIIQVLVQSCYSALVFGGGETEARDHGGKMPAEFDLFRFDEQAEEFWFVAVEEARLFGGDFFGSVRGAHADYGVFVPEAGNEFAKAVRLFENEASHFVGAADGAAVRAFEHRRDLLPKHIAKCSPKETQARARPAWVLSRRKSGAMTSTVRHISKRRERMRLPILWSRESSRTGMTSFPLGSRVASPSAAGLS